MAKANQSKPEAGKQERSAGAQVWQSVRANVRAELKDAAEMASLKMKLSRAEKDKTDLLRRLGEVSYARLRPRQGCVQSELEEKAEALAVRIGQKTHEIADLRLTIKLRKLGGDYTHITGGKK